MMFFAERPHGAVARDLGLSPKAVAGRLTAAPQRLRALLDRED